jgi:aryl-alcohol dehydrogenase-like predicted oxidoreductase
MDYGRLGRTGLKVSSIGLGCGNFGGIGSDPRFFGKGEDEKGAFAIMDRAWEVGINFFDTADAYGGGRSEEIIGRWLRGKGADVRQGLLVSSKVFNPVGDGPNDRGLSRRHVKRQVERSLSRLGVERLDMYLIHEPDPETHIEETLSALDDLIHAGKIHYVGASNIEAWRMTGALWMSEKLSLERFEWVQNNYSLLERGDEREILPLVADQNLGYTPFSPLAGGWLTGKYTRENPFPKGSRMALRPEPYTHLVEDRIFGGLESFRAKADEAGVEMATLAMAWVASHPLTTAIIVGPRNPEQLEPAVAASKLRLKESERQELAALFV